VGDEGSFHHVSFPNFLTNKDDPHLREVFAPIVQVSARRVGGHTDLKDTKTDAHVLAEGMNLVSSVA
jgi:hypothetical protein